MIGKQIKYYRDAKGLSQEALAEQLHVVRQTVSKWERELSLPDAAQLVRLAAVLEISTAQLLGEEPANSEELDAANAALAALQAQLRRRQKAGKVRRTLLLLSFLALVLTISIPNELAAAMLAGACMLAALGLLYRNLDLLSDEPAQTGRGILRAATIFSAVVVALVVLVLVLDRTAVLPLGEEGEARFAVALTACIILVIGAISPRLPFTRHTGLRLPWTVQDEDTWCVAHKILGVLSPPLALVYMALCWRFGHIETVSIAVILIWIGVPGLLSGVFFWKKMRGRL